MIWPALSFNLNRISLLLMTLWFPSRRKHNHTKREVKYLQALHVNLVETSALKPSLMCLVKLKRGLFMESSRHPVASSFRRPGSHLNHLPRLCYKEMHRYSFECILQFYKDLLLMWILLYIYIYSALIFSSFFPNLVVSNKPAVGKVVSLTNCVSSSFFSLN